MAPAPYKIPPIQPFKALKALARLMLDPQDTRQAALLTVALRGRSEAALYERFKASPAGLRVLRQRRRLSDVLDDRVYLAGLPADSLGAHLLAYLESEGFTAKELGHVTRAATDDLVAASPKVRLFADRMRDMHDIYHVMAGYGRDEFGEIYVLAFSYSQQRLRSFGVIGVAGAVSFACRLLLQGVVPRHVFGALLEAFAAGRQARWLPGEDIEAMLPENLETLRLRMNMRRPARYLALLTRLKRRLAPAGHLFFALDG
jgi:ubiquinone biosynthesis protein COQ4